MPYFAKVSSEFSYSNRMIAYFGLLSNHPSCDQLLPRRGPDILPWCIKDPQCEVQTDAMVQQEAQRVAQVGLGAVVHVGGLAELVCPTVVGF